MTNTQLEILMHNTALKQEKCYEEYIKQTKLLQELREEFKRRVNNG